jgi:uncharacterized membrane protein YdcZ (DUF606 family)
MELVKDAFSVCILFALMGGLAGSLLVTDYKRYGWFMTILFVLLGMILAAAVTDYFFPQNRPWLFCWCRRICRYVNNVISGCV